MDSRSDDYSHSLGGDLGRSGTITNVYFYDVAGHKVVDTDGSLNPQRTEIYAGGRHLATYQGGAFYYNHTNWLGTEAARSDSNGNLCETLANLPFGDALQTSGSCSPTPDFFTGKERDTESGNDYFGARYYASSMGRWMSPDWSAKEDPVPYAKLDDPQTLNLYDYVRNNPLSNVDADGHACSGVLGNTGSGFCTRASEYGMIDANPNVRSQTRFFAAANAVSQALADVNAPGSSLIGGISGKTASFLEGVGQKLEAFNEGAAHLIASGGLGGPGLDQQMVHSEQSLVQGQLDGLKQSDPTAYGKTISEINGALNPGAVGQFASTRFSTDAAYAGVLDGVRKDLGHNIDFSNQGDREAIGNALIKHIRQTGGCDVNGKKQGGC